MAKKPQDPLSRDIDEIRTSIEGWQDRLFHLWKVVFKKIKTKLKSVVSFVEKLVKEAGRIVATVGKSVVDKIIGAARVLTNVLDRVPNLIRAALRLGKKLISIIVKATDPSKIIGTLKRLVTRYINMIREIYKFILEFVSQLDVLGFAFSIINTFKTVLRLIVSWITDVTGAAGAIKKVQMMLKKIVKAMKVEIRQAIKTSKKAARLKAA